MESKHPITLGTDHHFQTLSGEYSRSRRGYLPKVLSECAEIAKATSLGARPLILDVGCGTGISTRSLAALGPKVIGVDPDISMIREALLAGGSRVAYSCCSATAIPWDDQTFDAVVSFGAFHWFASRESVTELYRLLRPGGSLIIVNKIDKGELRTVVRAVAGKYGDSIRDPKAKYDPASLLRENRFVHVFTKNINDIEIYAPGELAAHVRTMAPWSRVRPSEQDPAMSEILTTITRKAPPRLFIERPLRCRIVIGRKSQ